MAPSIQQGSLDFPFKYQRFPLKLPLLEVSKKEMEEPLNKGLVLQRNVNMPIVTVAVIPPVYMAS